MDQLQDVTIGIPTCDDDPLLWVLDLGMQPCELLRVMGTGFAPDRERLPRPEPFRLKFARRPGRLLTGEEIQLSRDVRPAGGRIRYEPGATVEHRVRAERLSWRWMLRRAYTGWWPERADPFPRALAPLDRALQLATTPALLAGRLRGSGG